MDRELLHLAQTFQSTEVRDVLIALEARRERRSGWWTTALLVACFLVLGGQALASAWQVIVSDGALRWVHAGLCSVSGSMAALIVVAWRMWVRLPPGGSTHDFVQEMLASRRWELRMWQTPALKGIYAAGVATCLVTVSYALHAVEELPQWGQIVYVVVAVFLILWIPVLAVFGRRRATKVSAEIERLQGIRADLADG